MRSSPGPHRLQALPSSTAKGAIEQLAEDIKNSRYLMLGITHAALGLYAKQKIGGKSERRGLQLAAANLQLFIERAAEQLEWPQLTQVLKYAKYESLRKTVLRDFSPFGDAEDAREYYIFVALMLLFIDETAQTNENFRRTVAYREIELFEISDYLDRLFSTDPNKPEDSYKFPRPQVAVSSLLEVLKQELGIENPLDAAIGNHFRIPASGPAKFLCYRFTTRAPDKTKPNKITKSFLEMHRPSNRSEIYSFKHRYRDIDGFDRVTSGFVVRLEKCFYFVGGSKKPEDRPTVGLKILTVPTDSAYTKYNHQLLSGLFMSNDSAMNPVAGRVLLVRVPDSALELEPENFQRIDEDKFIDDVKKVSSALLKEHDHVWLKDTITNFDLEWGDQVRTTLRASVRTETD